MKNKAWSRRLLLGCAAAVLLLTAGDSALTQAIGTEIGVDPLNVLDQQIKSNVLIVLDSSGSMRFPGDSGTNLGGDDYWGRMSQAKDAVSQVVTANAGKISFGLASYGVWNHEKFLAVTGDAGPLVYVSVDANAGTWTGPTPNYFDNNPTLDYLGTSAGMVYRSFATYARSYACADCAGTPTRQYLFSRILRNNVVFRFNTGSTTGLQSGYPRSYSCPNPPAGLFPQDPNVDADPLTSDIKRACFRVESTAAGNPGAVFFYTSGIFEGNWNSVSSCRAAANLASVAHCATDNTDTILGFLKPEMPVTGCSGTPEGLPCGLEAFENNTTTDLRNTNPPGAASDSVWGLLSAQATPLGGVLANVRGNFGSYFPSVEPGQRHFVLLLTDGDETCSGNPAAEALLNWNNNPRIETLVVGFGLNTTTLNQIARNGSGGARDAFTANSTQELIDVLNQALLITSSGGEFSSQPSVEASVFEFGAAFGSAGVDPFEGIESDPMYRFAKLIPALYQPTFEMPGFVGHFKAYTGAQTAAAWDAGDKLCAQVTGTGANTAVTPETCAVNNAFGGVAGNATFAQLTGTAVAPDYVPNGHLKRRIFTSSRNGVFPYAAQVMPGTEQVPVPLWPPTTTIDPLGVDPGYDNTTKTYPNGVLDAALGIATMDLATLQSTFKACQGASLPAHCTSSNTATVLSRARKEAREMILAYAAGAQVVLTAGAPTRLASGGSAGEILYKPKTWMLGEATGSSAVVVTQPLKRSPTSFHTTEYALFTNGTGHTADMSLGLGLRSPQSDEPRMSVVYFGANDMLHAFRAGPCTNTGDGCDAVETGGEELWGFVPFDQLGKLRLLLVEGQNRANHKYMIASALRVGDVFVPGTYDSPDGVTREGKWRTYLFFGRGIAGKHYTALDITTPGPFTARALETKPPLLVWNRGNPDTQDGLPPSPLVNPANGNYRTNNGQQDLGVNDITAYATMGQTWSTPALARVNSQNNEEPPSSLNEGLDFMFYAGSGYSGVSGEGNSFYAINPLTGDIITRADVGSGTGSVIPNAIPAPVAVFNPGQLVVNAGHPANSVGTRVYVGDLHGRLWKFDTNDSGTPIQLWDFGVNQPIAKAVALLNYDSAYDTPPSVLKKPHIYLATGDDRRVPPPPEEPADFVIAGLRDDEATTPPLATLLFSYVLPERYRGTAQPLTFLTSPENNAAGRVVYVVTRFNPVSATNCASSFDSRVYVVSAGLGAAVLDLDNSGTVDTGEIFIELPDTKLHPPRLDYEGDIEVDDALGGDDDDDKDLPGPKEGVTIGSQAVYVSSVNSAGSPVCRR